VSDADDQMGGQGGETGRAPGEGGAAAPAEHGAGAAPRDGGNGGQDPAESQQPDEDSGRSGRVDRYGEDSFPASDPPGAP
jgi:hypothetical protein